MMAVMTRIRLDVPDASIPAFLTMIAVPLTFSIADGLAIGLISYPLVKAFSGRWR
jgi:AGZA family xanthine/uracil permease-like MFS transporter